MSELLFDRVGRSRSPATMPGFHTGRPPRNKGLRYPADPPKVEEIVAVMRTAGDGVHGRRLRGLIVILWRAFARGSSCESSFRSVRCSASSTDQREAGTGTVRPPERSGAGPPSRQASVGASCRTSSGTRTRSRWRSTACR
jgi:hypothetical protein